jgi:two-component system phosphate regulon response regulator OmpR
VLRRCAKSGASSETLIRVGSIAIDLERRQATRNGATVDLTRSEFDLLATLMSKPGAVFSRERLLDCVQGGGSDAYDRAVDTHVSNLRKKLESDSKSPRLIKTVWGVGYRFDP